MNSWIRGLLGAAAVLCRGYGVNVTTAAFFDLDNTVVRGSSLFPFATALLRRRQVGLLDLARFSWLNAKFIVTRTESGQARDLVMTKALSLVAGQRESDVMALCRGIVPGIVRERTNPAVVAEIARHRRRGDQTWLITASPVELAREIAASLGMTGALGTTAQVDSGRYTGRLVGEVMHGARKAAAVGLLAEREGLELGDCWAYSDSLNDLPLLSLVGHPTVVNANKRLRQVAVKNGWRVLEPGARPAGSTPRLSPAAPSTRS